MGLPEVRRIAVIGGGITGLAAAHRVLELAPQLDVTLFEASPRVGGVLETWRQDGFLIEGGADNFITNVPWGVDLCRRIGFDDELVETNSEYRHAFVVRKGRLHKIPPGFVVMAPSRVWPVLSTPILSPLGKLRLACEPLVRRRTSEEDESLASFVTRRLGRETYQRLVQPLIGGIYTGDPQQLSLRCTMPRFGDMERNHGSLLRAMRHQARQQRQTTTSSGARYSMFVAPRHGMSSMVDAIASRLPSTTVRTGTPIDRLVWHAGRWSVTAGGEAGETSAFDAVILAVPANAASRLLGDVDPLIAEELAAVHQASCAIVSLAYRRGQIAHPLNGFGFVVPLLENRRILSGSFSSVKYPGRAPDGSVLLRVYIGGACQPELADLPDDQLEQTATEELEQLLGIDGGPTLVRINRRSHAMPQYYVGHADRVSRIQHRLADHQGLLLAGNAFDGVGIPNCIHSGEQTAERLVARLGGAESSQSGTHDEAASR